MKTAATVSPRRHTRADRGIPHMMPCGAIHAKVAIETFVFKKKIKEKPNEEKYTFRVSNFPSNQIEKRFLFEYYSYFDQF